MGSSSTFGMHKLIRLIWNWFNLNVELCMCDVEGKWRSRINNEENKIKLLSLIENIWILKISYIYWTMHWITNLECSLLWMQNSIGCRHIQIRMEMFELLSTIFSTIYGRKNMLIFGIITPVLSNLRYLLLKMQISPGLSISRQVLIFTILDVLVLDHLSLKLINSRNVS